VTFDEGQCRIRTQNAAQNVVAPRHITLNTLKRDTQHKDSIRAKRRRAGRDTDYLEYLLTLLGEIRKRFRCDCLGVDAGFSLMVYYGRLAAGA